MSNDLFNEGHAGLFRGATAIDTATYLAVLESSDSTWTPDPDNDSLLDQAGFDEIDVASYSRQTISSVSITADDGDNTVSIDCGDVAFGSLEAGQTVKSVIVARDDGGNLVPVLRIDTDSGGLLPRALGGGAFTLTIAAAGLLVGQKST